MVTMKRTREIYNKYELVFELVFWCFFIPICLTCLFWITLHLSTENPLKIHKIVLGIYSIYISILVVFFSVGFVVIPLLPTMSKNTSSFRGLRRTDIKKISKVIVLFLFCTGLGILMSLFGYFITSVSPKGFESIFDEYFIGSTFFVLFSTFTMFVMFNRMSKWLKL